VGGVVSAGLNIATMIPMANRLKNELRKYYLSEEEIHEIEEKEQITFSEKTSDIISDVAAESAETVKKLKGIGKNLGLVCKMTTCPKDGYFSANLR
jgi:ribosomal protein S13